MPRGYEHISFVFSSTFQDIFSYSFLRIRLYWEKRPLRRVWMVMITFFQFSIRNMVFHCIFLGKKAIIITSKQGTTIFFPNTILF